MIFGILNSSKTNEKWRTLSWDLVLYTVGLYAMNMNSSVWVALAAQAVRKKGGFEFFWATIEGGFSTFCGQK